jgi:hypothetical protein
MDDAEKDGSMIESVTTEHGPASQTTKSGQLIQDKIFETVILP